MRLTKWSENNNVIDESQAGFRKNHSTIDNIFVLQALIQKYISKPRGRFFCIFFDFQKAFDSIQHDKLWNTLTRKNINGKILNVLKSMYSKLKSCIKCETGLTDHFNCTVGKRQGCVTSPILFLLFINGLINYLGTNVKGAFFFQMKLKNY